MRLPMCVAVGDQLLHELADGTRRQEQLADCVQFQYFLLPQGHLWRSPVRPSVDKTS